MSVSATPFELTSRAALGPPDLAIDEAGSNVDAVVPQVAGKRLADLRLAFGQEAIPADQRHPDAGARE
jgi:hypothetical protein